ncbi:hypothetical protein P154DRAFT_546133 [Amniculicola lignicola CBS 123094]|uniref:Alpha-type protein kinase domain-containing protein n=1 Tax=Amniculicola lignicola CBS 123094 TaxID=1392246 RepID=A0A6A5WPM9_9PLEO|nr:hypothetical protein P154DRAFT_546133 [Amniculicola lignicola CBS 123094]
MRRRAEQEQLIAERLKLEGSASGISSSEANHRLSQIKREVQAAGATSPGRSTKGIFKDTCSTDLLFLIDTTGSMGCYINTAKEQVKSIVKDIKEAFLNEAEIRVAVVGYKDHGDPGNPEFLDFTTSTDEVFLFLNNLSATGGDDEPEDVLGGVKQALNASWRQQTRCIIHIADAPPHGRELQNSPPCGYDRWATPGSEPHGLTHPALLKQLISLKVNYAFLRIKAATDNMAFTFFKAYSDTSSDCKLHTANRYYTQANIIAAATHVNVRGSSSSTSKAKAAPAFQEMELGTKFSALQHLVVKMVTSSASRTAVRLSAQETYDSLKTKRRGIELREIREDEDDNAELLETAPPQWNSSSWFDHVLRVEGFSPDVVHGTGTLDDMMAHDDAIMMSVTQLSIRKRSKPFAQGAMRVASYALTSLSTTPYVVKSYKKDRKKLAHLAEDMRIQALCKAFALEFNALVGEESSLDFIATTCLKVKTGPASKDAVMSLEPFIGTSYVKYNGNKNYVNDDIPNDGFNKRAQAFSHFTFERSQGRFLVCDLQGVGSLLTDPAIHTSDPERFKLSDTNLGKEGFKFFFQAHACNEFCVKLALKSNKSMVIPERYTFREHWPRKDITACCSNKLCGKIVHLATVKKSTKYPGFYWCGDCWPQLSSTTKLMCVAKGPTHEFEVSKFFYESQGTSAPRKCNAHREEDIEMSRAEDTRYTRVKERNSIKNCTGV